MYIHTTLILFCSRPRLLGGQQGLMLKPLGETEHSASVMFSCSYFINEAQESYMRCAQATSVGNTSSFMASFPSD